MCSMVRSSGVEADDLSPWAVRPLVAYRHARLWQEAELIARSFPEHVPERPVLGQAVLMDLAWLGSYLDVAGEVVAGLKDARSALTAFIRKEAPKDAGEWLSVPFLDEPIRWEWRVRVDRSLGQALNRIMLPAMAWGVAFAATDDPEEALSEVGAVASAELCLASEAAPCWEEPIRNISRLLPQVSHL